jgi:glycosyltransferase involved in cell wall biosynthesis
MKITAIIPTLNEEIHIEDAIKSVSFADEIIVIDSFSNDDTIALAKKQDVTIIQRVFDDYSTQKNFAIAKAKHEWIYILDADERVTPALREEILDCLKDPSDFVGFHIHRTFYFAGKKINYSGFQHDKVIRLFRKDKCKYNGKIVHERIEAEGKVGFLKNKIEHYTYRSYDHFITKLNRYAALKAHILYNKNKRATFFHILIKPPFKFFIHYFIRLGFLDGFRGFILSVVLSYGVLARYIKLWLLKHNLD